MLKKLTCALLMFTGLSAAVKDVTTLDNFNKHIKSGTTIVKFSAKWCSPCNMSTIPFENLSKKYPKVTFLHVDVDQARPIATKYNIRGIPNFIVFNNNNKVAQNTGYNESWIIQQITKLS